MDKRGITSRTQANREKTFLSRVYRWGYERGIVKGNPCRGAKQFTEKARDRYITDEEYDAVYQVAPDVVRVAMEIAYLCLAGKRMSLLCVVISSENPGSISNRVRRQPGRLKHGLNGYVMP